MKNVTMASAMLFYGRRSEPREDMLTKCVSIVVIFLLVLICVTLLLEASRDVCDNTEGGITVRDIPAVPLASSRSLIMIEYTRRVASPTSHRFHGSC